MPIVFSLLQLMGATIDIQSEVGRGTIINVCIPQATCANSEPIGKETAMRLQKFEETVHHDGKKFSFIPESMPYGKVLIVDDVEANIYVARGLLAFYDLQVETCTNGYDAIEKIRQGNEYDIIFMDYMMPGINGTETMLELRKMGYTRSVVALTANALIGQEEEFIKNGFDGFVSKPIQTKHLNTVLKKHIRDKHPAEVVEEARRNASGKTGIMNFQDGDELQARLRQDFVRNQKNTFAEIRKAVQEGDIKTAHILVHTLKGVAGLIKETALAQAAEQVENLLEHEKSLSDKQLAPLQAELNCVIKSIEVNTSTPSPQIGKTMDRDKASELFFWLEPLLLSRNIEALEMLDELRKLPETFVLCKLIEDYEFKAAILAFNILKENFT
jgi:CheY-like chemotaxis protein